MILEQRTKSIAQLKRQNVQIYGFSYISGRTNIRGNKTVISQLTRLIDLFNGSGFESSISHFVHLTVNVVHNWFAMANISGRMDPP